MDNPRKAGFLPTMTFLARSRRCVVGLVFSAVCSSVPAADKASSSADNSTAPAVAASPSLFDYDRSAPLNLEVSNTETRNGVLIRDVIFSGHKDPITAYVV